MLEGISYCVFFFAIIITIVYFYIKAKYGFWVMQPVFHVYDIGYMINPPGIINHSLPTKNKYTNFINIETFQYELVPTFFISKITHLINMHYFRKKTNFFRLTNQQLVPYLKSHNDKVFISIYNEPVQLLNKTLNTVINDDKIISVITSRPLNVIINNGNKDATFTCYYVDYLCVNTSHRKKGIAPQMIQTHHYNQRHLNKKISVSLFKREDELTGIIPLCVYSTYGFSVEKWTKPLDIFPTYALVEVTASNIHLLVGFIKEQSETFDIIINCEISNLVEIINTNNVFVYMVVHNDAIAAAYFFRKTCIFIDTNLEVLSLSASINNCDANDVFIHSFKTLFWKIAAKHYFGYCSIENISHNNVIIDDLCIKNSPTIISPTAYFFYNFVYNTSPSNKVLIIN